MSIGRWFDKRFDDVKDAFSSKNGKDPFSRIGGALSPSTQLLKGIGVDWEGANNKFADWNNKKLSGILGTDNDSGGAAGWVGNKPATTIAALITGGSALANAGGGAAGGGSSSGTSSGWQDWSQMQPPSSGQQESPVNYDAQRWAREADLRRRRAIAAALRQSGNQSFDPYGTELA